MNVESKPLASIGIPTRNRAACLRQSLERILAQDYSNIEVLISDNCSEDDTELVCRQIMSADARVRYVRQPHNIGLHANHNFCIAQAHGEFLCLFHDHDRHDPGIIGEYVAFMRAHPRVGIVCSNWNLIDDDDVELGVRAWQWPSVMPGLDYISQAIRSGRSSVGTPGAMVRREALGDARFDLDAPIGFGDFPIWFRIAETWDIGHISKPLWSWRQNAVSHSARPIQDIARDFERNVGRYCNDHLARWPAHALLVDRWRASIGRFLFWALAYEVALNFRPPSNGSHRHERTLFEIMDYRLTPDQVTYALAEMKRHAHGIVERTVAVVVSSLVRVGFTSPLAWTIRHQAAARTILGLK
jgi:glycosyltransferase involved in cell wall biosynthesis